MKTSLQKAGKGLAFIYLIFVHLLAAGFVYERFFSTPYTFDETKLEKVKIPTQPTVLPAIPSFPATSPHTAVTAVNENTNQNVNKNTNQNVSSSMTANGKLMIPVVGIKREQLQDTFDDARSQGRVHNAIDIIAPLGTPVVATSDGEIVKFFDSERGGITIYQYSPDKRYVYYYAHLQKRDGNIKEGDFVKQGTTIGYVGNTGNAGPENYHLHFSISILDDPKKYFNGEDINPYPILKKAIESNIR